MFEKTIEQLKDITGPRFYFITLLLFLLSVGHIFKEPITEYAKLERFSTIEFRECRNLYGLEKEMNKITAAYPNVLEYGVYLYQPKQNSSYKKMVLTNSERARTSIDLQGIYLKDQPTINRLLDRGDYALLDDTDLKAPDLKILKDLNTHHILYYKLQVKEVVVGEIALTLAERPTAVELDMIIHELSPLLYLYIM